MMPLWKKYLIFLIDIILTKRLNHEGYKSNFSIEDKKRIDAKTILKSIHQENTNKLVFAHINTNLPRNKFELLVNQVKGNTDVLMISEKNWW